MPAQTPEKIRARLVELYQQLSQHTKDECTKNCRLPHSCCDKQFCDIAEKNALDRWGVLLPKTTHPSLPFMGNEGCIVPPHLRPVCTSHVCQVCSLGARVTGDKEADFIWNEKYWQLRDEISELEFDLEEILER